jgi:hypothetical protein
MATSTRRQQPGNLRLVRRLAVKRWPYPPSAPGVITESQQRQVSDHQGAILHNTQKQTGMSPSYESGNHNHWPSDPERHPAYSPETHDPLGGNSRFAHSLVALRIFSNVPQIGFPGIIQHRPSNGSHALPPIFSPWRCPFSEGRTHTP